MILKGDNDTVECEACGRLIHINDAYGFEDTHYCPGCSARIQQDIRNTKCTICKEKIGDEDYSYNTDDEETLAHSACVAGLPDEKQDEWSDEY